MAPDVLAERQQRAARVEQPGGVEASRAIEDPLPAAHRLRERREHGALHDRSVGNGCAVHVDVVDRSLPADAAARRGVEVPAEGPRVEGTRQANGDDVEPLFLGADVLAVRDAIDLVGSNEALGDQEARRELEVAAGGAHRDRDGGGLLLGPPGPDLHRLLGGQRVRAFRSQVPPHRDDATTGNVPAHRLADCHPPRVRGRPTEHPDADRGSARRDADLEAVRQACIVVGD